MFDLSSSPHWRPRSPARSVALRVLVMTLGLLSVGLHSGVEARADVTFPLHHCSSPWMTSAGSAWGTSGRSWTLAGGPPANFMVSFKPSKRGRTAPPLTRSFHWIWNDLRRCVKFPPKLSPTQSESLYEQMMCHVYWSTGPIFKTGGNTWDFEAWRPTVSRRTLFSPTQIIDKKKRCNWGPDTGPPLPRPSLRGNYRCDLGEFCLGHKYHLTGGVYDNPGSDNDLRNDRFTYYRNPALNPIVDNNSWSVWNHGRNGAYSDVVVYSEPGRTGSAACIALGRRTDLPASWRSRISSYRWVTRAECNRHPRL
jgi:Protein of unknown function (DUF2599)